LNYTRGIQGGFYATTGFASNSIRAGQNGSDTSVKDVYGWRVLTFTEGQRQTMRMP